MLTQSRLKELLDYDPDTGAFTWLISTNHKIKIGAMAGTVMSRGYRRIGFDGQYYRAHRLAWLYVHGEWPKDQIDHINGDPSDNRLINLREAVNYENGQNRKKGFNNSSGFIGVSWHSASRKWNARIQINKKVKSLGYFGDADAAYSAYLAAKAEMHTFNPTVRAAMERGIVNNPVAQTTA